MSFWSEVTSNMEKGKGASRIKVQVSDLADLRVKIERLEDELQSEQNKANQLILTSEHQRNELTAKNTQLEGEKDNMKSELETLKSQMESNTQYLQSQIMEKDGQVKKAIEQITEANAKIQELEKAIGEGANLKQSFDGLKVELDRITQERDQVKAGAEDVIANKQLEIDELSRQLNVTREQKNNEITLLRTQIGELEAKSTGGAAPAGPSSRELELEQLVSQLNKKNMELNEEVDRMMSGGTAKPAPPAPKMPTKAAASAPVSAPIKEVHAESSIPIPHISGAGRIVCPQCGSSKLNEVEDKSRVVSYIPRPMYGKKFVCSQCGFEFI